MAKKKDTREKSGGRSSKDSFQFNLNARPDTVDFRDLMYIPTLHEVPPVITPEEYMQRSGGNVLVLDQGKEGACTGYALATVANFLLRSRKVMPDTEPVSPKMIYRFARRYDEWPGEKYSGSSARGAMKAWHKHGVCSDKLDKYWDNIKSAGGREADYTTLIDDSRSRPLGAYFRVNHKDLVAMHSAMSEVGILFATASVHQNWRRPVKKYAGRSAEGKNIYECRIEFNHKDFTVIGGHAFCIVAYDREGFWVQNSWGEKWGDGGFAKLMYDDWLINGTDVWVARLGAPVRLSSDDSSTSAYPVVKALKNESSFYQFRSHIISLDNDGMLKQEGTYGHGRNSLTHIINGMDVTINTWKKKWKKRRILLYAHGGLVNEDSVIQRLSDYREVLLNNEIFPVFFMWHSDFWTTVKNMLDDALTKRKSKDMPGGIRDFMLDRADDFFEYILREPGKLVWKEMKENAIGAAGKESGGATKYLDLLMEKMRSDRSNSYEIHLIGHSAGSILLGPVVGYLKNRNVPVTSCTLWAPACTTEFFFEHYHNAVESGFIRDFNIYTLTDIAEQNDECASIYNKSLLYLVSNSFEEMPRVPVTLPYGTPLLGMEKFLSSGFWGNREKRKVNNEQMREQFELCRKYALKLEKLFAAKNIDWIKSPSQKEYSSAQTHGAFDDDKKCLESTISFILKSGKGKKGYGRMLSPIVQMRPSALSVEERLDKLNKRQEILNLKL